MNSFQQAHIGLTFLGLNHKWCFVFYMVHYIIPWEFKVNRIKKKKKALQKSLTGLWLQSVAFKSVCEFVVLCRRDSGCRWWGTWGPAWSWRRCRNGSITLYPPSFSSHPTRCSWTTSAPNATHCAKSWWINNRPRKMHSNRTPIMDSSSYSYITGEFLDSKWNLIIMTNQENTDSLFMFPLGWISSTNYTNFIDMAEPIAVHYNHLILIILIVKKHMWVKCQYFL